MNDKDILIKQLMQRIESFLEKMQQLEAENLELKERIARLEKNSATSSKPPSSEIIHPQPTGVVKKKKRRHGGQAGHPKHRRQPFPAETIDETIVHKLSDEEVQHRQLVVLPQKVVASWSDALLEILRKIFKSWKCRHNIDPNCYRRKIEKLRKAFLRRVRRPPSELLSISVDENFSSGDLPDAIHKFNASYHFVQ